MSTIPITTRTLRGKYQVTKNIFVTCYVDVLEANGQEIRTFVWLKKRSDTLVPVGTRIFFNVEAINRINVRRNRGFDIFSITVQHIEDMSGNPLHVCSPITKETRTDMRKEERRESAFPVKLSGTKAEFMAVDGTAKGLTLHYIARRAMLSLSLGSEYPFLVNYKYASYTLPGEVKHIQYDWRSHNHVVGIHFPRLDQEEETILNLLLDPSYTVDLSDRQTIDTALGKISLED